MPEPIKLTACGDEPPQFASNPSQRLAASRALSALSVLIVDDNQDAAESMAMLVSMSGHVVQTAHTPVDAILATDRDPPDVVVMDIGLPGIDGYQLAQKICERLTLRPLLVAIMGHANINDRSRQEGFDHHLLKPVDAVELLAILDARVQYVNRPVPDDPPATVSDHEMDSRRDSTPTLDREHGRILFDASAVTSSLPLAQSMRELLTSNGILAVVVDLDQLGPAIKLRGTPNLDQVEDIIAQWLEGQGRMASYF